MIGDRADRGSLMALEVARHQKTASLDAVATALMTGRRKLHEPVGRGQRNGIAARCFHDQQANIARSSVSAMPGGY